MTREKKLLINTGILALGDFFPKFLTVLITPILTLKLTQVEYGEYDLIITIVSLLIPIATLQISSAVFRFLITKRDDKAACDAIISTVYLFVIVMSIIAGIIYYLCVGQKSGVVGIFVSIYFVCNVLLITTQQVLRGLGKNLIYSLSAIIQAVVSLVCFFLLTGGLNLPNYGLLGVTISLSLSTTIPFLLLMIKCNILSKIKPKEASFKLLKSMLLYSWPMVPNNLSLWVLGLSDRLLITAFLGLKMNAIYAVANKLPSIFSSLQGAFITAWQESASLAKEDDDKDEYYTKMCDWVYRLLTGIMSGLIMCTPIIWRILIHGDYEEAYCQLPILYIAMMFNCMSSTIGGIYIAHMKTKSVGLTTMASAVINFVINIIFIQKIGIWAASLSTLISYFLLWLFRMYNVQRFQRINFDKKMIICSIFSLSLMTLLNYQQKLFFDCINVIICLCILIFFDRKIIMTMYDKFIKSKFKK
ncbi:lipopolysaccharide biosynthesis protein [Clostridium perfringens]|uniref:lipopolysaccharide biosynthesis protein n=1 Tax=Clostridium perfringens TaxID=1502 RepID=UPI0007768667|nr:polysaccharide biosynthesis C-terminal domain-containing protein [Clostridium perfringens]AMN31882.1 hypothetical protein JFP55_02740 [Clostridium perfringens]